MQKLLCISLGLILGACSHKQQLLYNGYIDADLTYLSSDYAGRLSALYIKKGDSVTKQQLLFKVEQTNEALNIMLSKQKFENLLAQQNEIKSKIKYAKIDYVRKIKLKQNNAGSQADIDQAKQNLEVLTNQLVGIEAQIAGNTLNIDQQKWQLERKTNYAPESGIIFDTYINHSEYVAGGQPILSLLTANNVKIIFFAAETQLKNIHLQQLLHFTTDGSNLVESAVISYISNKAEYTPPIIFSREDRQKLVFRVEARLKNPNLMNTHVGQPVTVELLP